MLVISVGHWLSKAAQFYSPLTSGPDINLVSASSEWDHSSEVISEFTTNTFLNFITDLTTTTGAQGFKPESYTVEGFNAFSPHGQTGRFRDFLGVI